MKYILFDWGRTLYDKDKGVLFEGVIEMMQALKPHYPMAIVSIADDGDIKSRFKLIDRFGLRPFIAFALFHKTDKDSLIQNALCNLNAKPEETFVFDDRMQRLLLPIHIGCKTVWISQGKYAHETPSYFKVHPTYIIEHIREYKKVLD